MLNIMQLQEIEEKLREISTLVESYSKRDSAFAEYIEKWLREVEEVLKRNRLAISANIAGLRGILISVKEGALPQGVETTARITLRKRRAIVAADIASRAVEIVDRSIQSDRKRLDEAERVALQLIAVARANNMVHDKEGLTQGPELARGIITSLKSVNETVQGITHLEGLAGSTDAIIIIDRLLAR